MKTLGIDALSIRDGGGLGHLRNICKHFSFHQTLFGRIVLFLDPSLVDEFYGVRNITLVPIRFPKPVLFWRYVWQLFSSKAIFKKFRCDIMFVAGGVYIGSFRPFVTICHNVLPFRDSILLQYGAVLRFKNFLLQRALHRTFEYADGVIFPSHSCASEVIGRLVFIKRHRVIYHGVDNEFRGYTGLNRNSRHLGDMDRLRLAYVSSGEIYKNHESFVRAISSSLEVLDVDVSLTLVGKIGAELRHDLLAIARGSKKGSDWLKFVGFADKLKVLEIVGESDVLVWVSSTESFGIGLAEALATGLPILVLDTPVNREIVSSGEAFFVADLSRQSIKNALDLILLERTRFPFFFDNNVFTSGRYNWTRSALDTLSFIHDVVDLRAR